MVRGAALALQHRRSPQDPRRAGGDGHPLSRVMIGMLVVQDLAVVPLITVLPELKTGRGTPRARGRGCSRPPPSSRRCCFGRRVCPC